MRKTKRLSAVIFAGVLLFVTLLPAAAAQNYNDNISRVIDCTDTLTESEINNINEKCIHLVSTYRVDAAALLVTPEDYSGMTLSEIGDKKYSEAGFGYGDTSDGFIVVYDLETDEICVNTYGAVTDLMTENYVNMLETSALEQLPEYGPWGVLIFPSLTVKNSLERLVEEGRYTAEPVQPSGSSESGASAENGASSGSGNTSESGASSGSDTSGGTPSGSDKPYWYPSPDEPFTPFHNETASRVVDDADIFTSDDESSIAQLIKHIQDTYRKDIVVYTTSDDYGMDKEALSSDFYDYCGYGLGDGYEGMCLLFVMDPDSRGFKISGYGEEIRKLYTKENADYMDDSLYHFVKDKTDENGNKIPGEYAAGVINWIEDAENMFSSGHADLPSWQSDGYSRSDGQYVTMEVPFITAADAQLLNERCKSISEKTGIDVVINLTNSLYRMTIEEYAEKCFREMGFGKGGTRDGMLLVVLNNESADTYTAYTYVSGNRLDYLTDVNYKRLSDHAVYSSNDPYESAERWLGDMEHMADTGRVMPAGIYWFAVAVVSLLLGIIISVVLILRDDAKDKRPRVKKSAAHYAVKGTLSVIPVAEIYVRTRKEETYDPETKSSGGGGSSNSGASTYNSSYTSSSGRTHVTSGRDF